jgi:hypothetical protein
MTKQFLGCLDADLERAEQRCERVPEVWKPTRLATPILFNAGRISRFKTLSGEIACSPFFRMDGKTKSSSDL